MFTDVFITKAESAKRLRCSPRKVERLIQDGKLRKAGDKSSRVLIPIEDQLRYEEELRQAGRHPIRPSQQDLPQRTSGRKRA